MISRPSVWIRNMFLQILVQRNGVGDSLQKDSAVSQKGVGVSNDEESRKSWQFLQRLWTLSCWTIEIICIWKGWLLSGWKTQIVGLKNKTKQAWINEHTSLTFLTHPTGINTTGVCHYSWNSDVLWFGSSLVVWRNLGQRLGFCFLKKPVRTYDKMLVTNETCRFKERGDRFTSAPSSSPPLKAPD